MSLGACREFIHPNSGGCWEMSEEEEGGVGEEEGTQGGDVLWPPGGESNVYFGGPPGRRRTPTGTVTTRTHQAGLGPAGKLGEPLCLV